MAALIVNSPASFYSGSVLKDSDDFSFYLRIKIHNLFQLCSGNLHGGHAGVFMYRFQRE